MKKVPSGVGLLYEISTTAFWWPGQMAGYSGTAGDAAMAVAAGVLRAWVAGMQARAR